MVRGKTIQLFLIDGEPKGRIKCTLANWTGVAYKIPRINIEHSRDIYLLSQSGVYFLFGRTDDTDEEVVYIGQAGARKNNEGVLNRLSEHKKTIEKDYWTEAVVFTTTNNSFGPTEISYLENQFYLMATQNKRFIVKNNLEPTIGNVTEEKESELQEFIDYAKIVIGTLGYKIFEPLLSNGNVDRTTQPGSDEVLFFIKRNSRKSKSFIEAQCKQTSEGFVVLEGSRIDMVDSPSIPKKVKEIRRKAKTDVNGILQEDKLFKSPSYAASFVLGSSANGKTEWRTIEGKSLNDLEFELSESKIIF